MTRKLNTQPIGIFDSGIGGLTVAKAVVDLLPHENIVYFGDTAHLPYGDKSAKAIQAYSLKIVELLLAKNCKAIVIACNSISTAAYQILRNFIDHRAILIDVIDPVINKLADEKYAGKKIGLIGTRQTIKSNIYFSKVSNLKNNIGLKSLATPLLVPLIEEGFSDHQIMDQLLPEYLKDQKLLGIEALILGCTHYPILKEKIAKFYQGKIEVIDSSMPTAIELKKKLIEQKMLNAQKLSQRSFYVSDLTDVFVTKSKLFFGHDINLELRQPG